MNRLTTIQDAGAAPGTLRIVLTVFLPFALGYFLSYLYRTVNAVIVNDLAETVGVDPAGLGLLTSAYFIAFASFQLPLGILLDRYGPRRVEATLLVVAATGALVFAFGDTIGELAAGRALIGLGVSACLMAALKANVQWWPRHRLPLVNGLFLAAGGLGALAATTPVAALLTLTDWRGVFVLLALLTLCTAALIFLAVPEARTGRGTAETLMDQIRGAGRVYGSAVFWRLAPASMLIQGGFIAYLALWQAPWLRDVELLDRAMVARYLQDTALAMVAGYAVCGFLAERLDRLGIRPITVTAVCVTLAIAAQVLLIVPVIDAPLVLWVAYGFFATGGVLSYSILSQAFPPELAGRANTALNMLVFVSAFAIQAGVGVLLGLFPTTPEGGYSPTGHRLVLTLITALEIVAVAWLAWPRRHTRPSSTAAGSVESAPS